MTNKDSDNLLDVELKQLFLAALLERGWKLPTTPEEVVFTDKIKSSDIVVPDSLKSASSVFEEILKTKGAFSRASRNLNEPASENLALAAREGGQISESARALMDSDRSRFEEGELDGGPSKSK